MNRKLRFPWMTLWLGIPAAALFGCDSAVSAPLSTAQHQAFAQAATAGACVASPSGLVSWWPGDGSANDLQDGNDGVRQNGAGFAPGMVGSAFSLDGADDHVLVPNSANLHLTAFTLVAWINTADATLQQPIIAKAEAGGNWVSYMLRISGGRLNLTVNNRGQDRYAHWFTVSSLPSNQWLHVAGTWQNVSGDHTDAKIYIDGVEQVLEMTHNRGYNSTFAPGYTTLPLYIGRDEQPSGYFAGLIDEADVYDRVLTAAEIQELFAAGSAGKCRPGGDCDAALAAAQQQIATLTAQNTTLTAQNAALTAENAALTADNVALTAQNAVLTTQNAALTAQNAGLLGQLGQLAAEVTRVENDLRTAFGDPAFTIPGASPAERMNNLADAIVALNNGRKSGIYTYLRSNP